jgi:membrane protein
MSYKSLRRQTGPVLALIEKVYRELAADRILAVSGGITFFFLLALFPAIASIVSLYGLLADRAAIAEELRLVSGFLPEGAVALLQKEVHRLISVQPVKMNLAFLASLSLALWSASGGAKALIDGLNIAFEVEETRGFAKLAINGLGFTLAGILLLIGLVAANVEVPRLITHAATREWGSRIYAIAVWPALYLGCSTVLSLIYRHGPNRKAVPWKWITWGSAIASALWMAGTSLFTLYVRHFGNYDRVYGELGAVVGFLTWVWLSTVIILLGAEIVSVMEGKGRGKTKRAHPAVKE